MRRNGGIRGGNGGRAEAKKASNDRVERDSNGERERPQGPCAFTPYSMPACRYFGSVGCSAV